MDKDTLIRLEKLNQLRLDEKQTVEDHYMLREGQDPPLQNHLSGGIPCPS